ncbi:MAG: ROK family protein, partial [Chloroflexi bacterium]|nr:ROK family protein [Chloroflexota bacterium]
MSEPEPVVVAVDFTADELRLMLCALDGEPLLRQVHPLPALPTEEAWAWEVGGRIATMFAAEGEKRWALAIGIACPGIVDGPAGRIVESIAQEGWDGLSVVEALRRHIDAPTVILSRAEASLRGEAAAGAASHVFDALYVALDEHPAAAVLSAGRIVGGGARRAGALPALPEM